MEKIKINENTKVTKKKLFNIIKIKIILHVSKRFGWNINEDIVKEPVNRLFEFIIAASKLNTLDLQN